MERKNKSVGGRFCYTIVTDFRKSVAIPLLSDSTKLGKSHNIKYIQSLPYILHRENIGAINWGLVAGKTNTIFAWDTPLPDVVEPPLWFHDIFRSDGTPYSTEEVECIRSLTK